MFYKNFYKGLSEEEIKKKVVEEEYEPIRFTNGPGDIYNIHKHPETKLLVFIKGDMCVTVAGKHYNCEVGDKLIIPGNVEHSAKVGDSGCTFLWSEKLV